MPMREGGNPSPVTRKPASLENWMGPCLPPCHSCEGRNFAGEPRDDVKRGCYPVFSGSYPELMVTQGKMTPCAFWKRLNTPDEVATPDALVAGLDDDLEHSD